MQKRQNKTFADGEAGGVTACDQLLIFIIARAGLTQWFIAGILQVTPDNHCTLYSDVRHEDDACSHLCLQLAVLLHALFAVHRRVRHVRSLLLHAGGQGGEQVQGGRRI